MGLAINPKTAWSTPSAHLELVEKRRLPGHELATRILNERHKRTPEKRMKALGNFTLIRIYENQGEYAKFAEKELRTRNIQIPNIT